MPHAKPHKGSVSKGASAHAKKHGHAGAAKKGRKDKKGKNRGKNKDGEDFTTKMWVDITMVSHVAANALCVVCMALTYWFADEIIKQTAVNKKKPLVSPSAKQAAAQPVGGFYGLPAGVGYIKPILVPMPNWDPILLIVCFLFLTVTMLNFEALGYKHHVPPETTKFMNITRWFTAVGCVIISVVTMYESYIHDPTSGYIAVVFRVFFYVSLFVYLLYFLLYLGAMCNLDWSNHASLGRLHRLSARVTHKWVFPVVYYGTAGAILIGFTDHNLSSGNDCLIPQLCLPGHGVGIVIGVITGLNLAANLCNFVVIRRRIQKLRDAGEEIDEDEEVNQCPCLPCLN